MKVKTIFISTILSSIMLCGLSFIFIKPIIFLYSMAVIFISFCVISIWFMFYSFLNGESKPTEEQTQEQTQEPEETQPVEEPKVEPTVHISNENGVTVVRDETLAKIYEENKAKLEKQQKEWGDTSTNGWW